MKFFPRIRSSGGGQASSYVGGIESEEFSLACVEPGIRVKVRGFTEMLGEDKQAHLLAYGVVPGRWVKVLRHSPVTILQVEHTELALERKLSKQILIERLK